MAFFTQDRRLSDNCLLLPNHGNKPNAQSALFNRPEDIPKLSQHCF